MKERIHSGMPVTIIIPAYNAGRFLRGAIESALAQTYSHLEILVVNDGSKDDTRQVAESFAARGVRLINQENKGVAGSRNAGIRAARSKWIAFLDADDFYAPTKIAREVEFLAEHPEFDLVYCNMHHFYEGKPEALQQHQGKFPSGDVFDQLLDGFFGQLNTVLFPKRAFEEAGFFDEQSHHSEEWDLMLRLARAGYRFGFLNEALVRICFSPTSLSRLENQWDMKKHNVVVFERLAESMSREERRKFRMEERIGKLRVKLAIAYLVAKRKSDFAGTLRSAARTPGERALYGSAAALGYIMPASFSSAILKRLWTRRHRKLFRPVSPETRT